MEKSAGKKMGPESVAARLKRMALVMNTALRTEVQASGEVVTLENPTILRTPAARATGEIAAPEQDGERVILPADRVVSLSDLADHSASALGRPNEEVLSPNPLSARVPMPENKKKGPSGDQREDVLASPQEHVIGIGSSTEERRTRTGEIAKGQSSCARTSPYPSPASAAERSGRQTPEGGKKKEKEKVQRKRAREEKRAETAHKKLRKDRRAEAGTSAHQKKTTTPEEGRRSESTIFELPLYTPHALEKGFVRFATKTLSLGLHEECSRIGQAAILATHSAHSLFRAAKEEAEMLANKNKYQVLVRAHEERAKEIEEKAAKMDEMQAELMDKANRYESVQAALEDQATELEMESALKKLASDQCEELKRELAETQAKAITEREENQANVVAVMKELEEARARAAELEKSIEPAKLKAVEEFKSSAALKDLELQWKQEAYYEGVDSNFKLLTHYGAIDLPKFLAASDDPNLQEGAPKETYAEQWGHLLSAEEEEGVGGEEANT